MNFSEALPTFLITLREGFEAALVVGIVLACLKKSQKSDLNSWVYSGVGLGIVASAFVGVLFSQLIKNVEASTHPYAPFFGQVMEAGFGLFAIAMLSWMLIWMTQQAKSLKSEVEGAVLMAVSDNNIGAGWGIFGLVFIAVLREGFETVLFIVAQFQQSLVAAFGALLGLLLAAGLGVLLFKWGVKIDIRLFFKIMGFALLLIVSGLVISVLKHVEAATLLLTTLNENYANLCFTQPASCILGPLIWDGSYILPDGKFPGVILKALLGYRDHLYLVQILGYILFLLTVGGLYFQSLQGKTSDSKATPSTQSN